MDEQITGRTRRTWYEGKLHRALEESDLQVSLGAERDGRLVGAMLGSVHYGEFGLPEPVAVLDTVLVDHEYRGQGVGTAIFEQLTKNLQALRIERLRTEVAWDDHELMAFFGKKGFSPIPRLVLEADLTRDLG
jgi:GNAT superfamily N-acetyltransferase